MIVLSADPSLRHTGLVALARGRSWRWLGGLNSHTSTKLSDSEALRQHRRYLAALVTDDAVREWLQRGPAVVAIEAQGGVEQGKGRTARTNERARFCDRVAWQLEGVAVDLGLQVVWVQPRSRLKAIGLPPKATKKDVIARVERLVTGLPAVSTQKDAEPRADAIAVGIAGYTKWMRLGARRGV